MSVTDRKTQNGPGSRRIEMGSGSESTTVQNAKASATFVSSLVDKYSGKSEDVARADVQAFANVNPDQAATGSKTTRAKGKMVVKSPIKGGPEGQSDYSEYITAQAERYKMGGEKITGSQKSKEKPSTKKEKQHAGKKEKATPDNNESIRRA